MKAGKLKNSTLEERILTTLSHDSSVLVGPGVGRDCAVVRSSGDVLVVSGDPITGTTKELADLAIHINANDLAASGTQAQYIMCTLLAPPETPDEEIVAIMDRLRSLSEETGLSIIGGHTERTPAVNQILLSLTVMGFNEEEKVITGERAVAGDVLLLTKGAAIEGTAILVGERPEAFTEEERELARGYFKRLSVVREGLIAAQHAVHAMHDVTEGGVLGGLWEICEAAELGCEVSLEDETLLSELTRKVGEVFEIDPYRLISSGAMLMAVPPEGVDPLTEALQAQDIAVYKLGTLTSGHSRRIRREGRMVLLNEPEADELYKVLG